MAKRKADRSINTVDVLIALKTASKPPRKPRSKKATFHLESEPHPQLLNLANLKVEIREQLDRLGVPKLSSAAVGSFKYESSVQQICTKINELVAKFMEYTFDENLKPDSMINLTSSEINVEIWVAKWREFLQKATGDRKGKVKDDCDGYSTIALILAWAAGIPAYRLAFGVVISETALIENRNRKPVTKLQFDHAIGIYWAFDKWWTLGDTWDQDRDTNPTLVDDRHVLYMYSLFNEGFSFRYGDDFEKLRPLGLKPLTASSVAARPVPTANVKKYARRFVV